MALYHPHTTEGIIIDHRPVGESSWWCSVLTRDYGLVKARSQGTREVRSKLRPHIQLWSYGSFSFIRGRHGWRMTHAHALVTFSSMSPESRALFSRVCSLLTIVVAGEERHVEIYDVIKNAFAYAHASSLSPKESGALERLVVLRLLYHLGYVGVDAIDGMHYQSTSVTPTLLEETYVYRRSMIQLINSSLRETQF